MTPPHLTAGERAALNFVYSYQRENQYSHCDFPFGEFHHKRFCPSLVHKGLLTPLEQGQNPLRERASRWTVWAITDAGKAAIEETT